MKHNDSAYGWILVSAQFVLIGILIFQLLKTAVTPSIVVQFIAGAVFLVGLALFAFTQYFNRPGNWSVHPLPKSNGQLVTTGPYKLIRHPMYSAALLCACAVAVWTFSWVSLLCTVALIVVFAQKIKIEEREMAAKFPDWADYTSRTKRLIPKVW
jgi:protein-S-isoprenylcysteine O-methyltransferase Ste14